MGREKSIVCLHLGGGTQQWFLHMVHLLVTEKILVVGERRGISQTFSQSAAPMKPRRIFGPGRSDLGLHFGSPGTNGNTCIAKFNRRELGQVKTT